LLREEASKSTKTGNDRLTISSAGNELVRNREIGRWNEDGGIVFGWDNEEQS
jgi:hypothetical protein